jgi:hypothetical protein
LLRIGLKNTTVNEEAAADKIVFIMIFAGLFTFNLLLNPNPDPALKKSQHTNNRNAPRILSATLAGLNGVLMF